MLSICSNIRAQLFRSCGLGIAFCLVACNATHSPAPTWTTNSPTPLTAPTSQALSDFLRANDVVPLNQGQRVALAIPADALFMPGTTTFTDEAPHILDGVTLYVRNALSQLPAGTSVKVLGFSDNIRTLSIQKQQAQQYANIVGSYLWAHGVHAKQLRLVGYGSAYPIAENTTPAGAAFNRRIVIITGP